MSNGVFNIYFYKVASVLKLFKLLDKRIDTVQIVGGEVVDGNPALGLVAAQLDFCREHAFHIVEHLAYFGALNFFARSADVGFTREVEAHFLFKLAHGHLALYRLFRHIDKHRLVVY